MKAGLSVHTTALFRATTIIKSLFFAIYFTEVEMPVVLAGVYFLKDPVYQQQM